MPESSWSSFAAPIGRGGRIKHRPRTSARPGPVEITYRIPDDDLRTLTFGIPATKLITRTSLRAAGWTSEMIAVLFAAHEHDRLTPVEFRRILNTPSLKARLLALSQASPDPTTLPHALKPAELPPAAALVRPSATDAARRYRQLVASVESREANTAGRRAPRSTTMPIRLQAARAAVLLRCRGHCENPTCAGQPIDVTDSGDAILEVDHVIQLADGGRDHPSQMVALCPNCHAVKGRGRGREALTTALLAVAAQAHATWTGSTD